MILHDGVAAHDAVVDAFADGSRALVGLIFELLDAAIADEGTDDYHVGDGGCGEDLE